jgi:hypothetical protein
MRVSDLTKEHIGTRLRVVSVAVDGGHDDTVRLIGQTGTVKFVSGGMFVQAGVDWDGPTAGSLMLAGEDRIELLR